VTIRREQQRKYLTGPAHEQQAERSDEGTERSGEFVCGRTAAGPTVWKTWPGWIAGDTSWPSLEVSQTDHKLMVRVDLPGVKRNDVVIEVRDSKLCIFGERRRAPSNEAGACVRSELSYGRFCRTVPLPNRAGTDDVRVAFADGVLRIEIDTASRGQE
jgi:HSP20 family molecular chaperone IbpA